MPKIAEKPMMPQAFITIGKLLVAPIISMYSKATGKYLPLFDGNMHSVLNLYWRQFQSNAARLAFPRDELIDPDQLQLFKELYPGIYANRVIAEYSGNVQCQRAAFWRLNETILQDCDCTAIATSITNMPLQLLKAGVLLTFICPVSKQKHIQQPCDVWLECDIAMANYANTTLVNNSEQLALLPKDKCFLLNKTLLFCTDFYKRFTLHAGWQSARKPWDSEAILVPFRLSDAEYGFDLDALANCREQFVLTDPNSALSLEVAKGLKLPANVSIKQYTKLEYIRLLATRRPKVLYSPNPSIYHIGVGELDMFDAEIVKHV